MLNEKGHQSANYWGIAPRKLLGTYSQHYLAVGVKVCHVFCFTDKFAYTVLLELVRFQCALLLLYYVLIRGDCTF